MTKITNKFKNSSCSIYEFPNPSNLVTTLISSTEESRAITNDPLVYGINYTEKLKTSCAKTLQSLLPILPENIKQTFNEHNTCVLNILRGGLNFGLREALADSYKWNNHSAAFLSAQRARTNSNPEEWYITESNYQKVYLPEKATIIFGDVVATGTSLEFALSELLNIAKKQDQEISSLIFFTIGGPRSHEILETISIKAKKMFPSFQGSVVIYLEGCFSVATTDSALSIKYTGTDLLRTNSILSKEFIESQFTKPEYPIERCTIYDAGSRAFWIPEYLEDVIDYWEKTLHLANNGMTYINILEERFPELQEYLKEANIDFSTVNLKKLCENQIQKLKKI